MARAEQDLKQGAGPGLGAQAVKDPMLLRWCAEEAKDAPPRLCREDLSDPQAFHRRLKDWLEQQCGLPR